MNFKYKAINKEKEEVEDSIVANSEKEVLLLLRTNDLKPIWIKKDFEKSREIKITKRIINKENLQIFLYKLYILTYSNITIPESIKIIVNDTKNKKEKEIYFSIFKDLDKGYSFAESIEKQNYFPKFLVSMIKIGEESSNLNDVFLNLSNYYKDEIKFEKEIKSAMYYPILLLLITFMVVNFLMISVLPKFTEMFYSDGEKLPFITKILIKISNFSSEHIITINLFLLILFISIVLSLKTEKGGLFIDRIKLKSKLYRYILIKKFSEMMYLLLSSNITIYNAVELTAKSVDNKIFSKELESVRKDIYNGENLSDSLENISFFPSMYISMIRISEYSGRNKDVFKNLISYYEYEVKFKQDKFIKFFEPVLIIILSLIVGFVILAIAIPMFDVVNII